ncbi:MAG: hypothetical protein HY367_00230 [Candidatus Aenigmarchaeota archaeon]|nr:hypothetical protein [Candidatus Aenigmarchaeota archaeon]
MSLAAYATALPIQIGIEYVQDLPKQEQVATLKKSYAVPLLNTHGQLFCGDFESEDGRMTKMCDSIRVLEGKLFFNSVIPSLEEGKEYAVSAIGSEHSYYTILDAGENR